MDANIKSPNNEKELSEKKQDTFSSVEKERVVSENVERAAESEGFLKDNDEHQKIRQQLENMDLDDSLKAQASSHAAGAQSLADKEKITHLLQIAKSKGVVYAVAVAKKMDDPFLLDVFHDMLVKNGYYKDFLK